MRETDTEYKRRANQIVKEREKVSAFKFTGGEKRREFVKRKEKGRSESLSKR